MENNQTQGLGKGIMILCIIQLIFSVPSIFSTLNIINSGLSTEQKQAFELLGISAPSQIEYIITMVISLLIIISLILILMKKSIGVYMYFVFEILSIIFALIMNGFGLLIIISSVLSLIFPILMAIFISKKKTVFGFGTPIA